MQTPHITRLSAHDQVLRRCSSLPTVCIHFTPPTPIFLTSLTPFPLPLLTSRPSPLLAPSSRMFFQTYRSQSLQSPREGLLHPKAFPASKCHSRLKVPESPSPETLSTPCCKHPRYQPVASWLTSKLWTNTDSLLITLQAPQLSSQRPGSKRLQDNGWGWEEGEEETAHREPRSDS